MDHISNLRLSDVRLFLRWTTAPLGAILQMRPVAHRIIVGMRTQFEAANKVSDALVILGGDEAGKLLTDDYFGEAVALDLGTQLVEIIAVDPAPFNINPGVPLSPGTLLRLGPPLITH